MKKSKISKIQILMKGMSLLLASMFLLTPIANATTSLDDGNYLESSIWDKLLYGEIGSTVKEIEKYFLAGNTILYIKNETHLRAFAQYVNNGNDCEGKKVVLLNDILISSSEEWIPIGVNSEVSFEGTEFNGNNYKISGLTNSLFGYVGEFYDDGNNEKTYTKIADVELDIKIDTNSNNIGGVVGSMYGGRIEDCYVHGEILGKNYVGGIAGTINGTTIYNCYNVSTVKGVSNVGGIVGKAVSKGWNDNAAIELCNNSGKVYGITNDGFDFGGIVGASSNITITRCLNEETIKGNENHNYGTYVGGIVGFGEKTIIESSGNKGSVYGEKYIGGIIGELDISDFGTIKNSYNKAVLVPANVNLAYKTLIGGIAGNINSRQTVDIEKDIESKLVLENNAYAFQGIEEHGNVYPYYEFEDIQKIAQIYHDAGSDIWYYTKFDEESDEWIKHECDKCNNMSGIEYNGWTQIYQLLNVVSKGRTKEHTCTPGTLTIIGGYGSDSCKWNGDVLKKLYTNKACQLFCYYGEVQGTGIAGTKDTVLTDILTLEKVVAEDKTSWDVMEGDTTLESKKFVTVEEAKFDIKPSSTAGIIGTKKEISNVVELIATNGVRTTLSYELYKNDVALTEGEGYAKNDEIVVKAKFDKILYTLFSSDPNTGNGVGSRINLSTAPTLCLKVKGLVYPYNYEEIISINPSVEPTFEDTNTILEYRINVNDLGATDYFKNLQILDVYFSGNNSNTNNDIAKMNYYAFDISMDNTDIGYEELKKYIISVGSENTNLDIASRKVYIDTVAPSLNATAYVEETLATGRYTAGKEVLIEVKTLEEIKNHNIVPEIEVSFSNSGVGKYNSNGYAKNVKASIDINGMITWIYLYQIQEGDEGQLQFTVHNIKNIKDIAGNTIGDVSGVKVEEGKDVTIISKKIYADTTSPTVTIKADKSNPTNADKITYTFEFSETVEGFTADDITVNNGNIVADTFTNIKENEIPTNKYEVKIRPSIVNGNQGELQVIVEAGVCKDLVAIDNIRQENSINIDKVKPTFEHGTIRQNENGEVIIEAVFSENISDIEDLELDITVGRKTAVNTDEVKVEIIDNKVKYTYTPNSADGGKVQATLNGIVVDNAGNSSESLSETLNSEVVLEKTVINDKVTEGVYYTFEKNNEGTIKDYTKPTYFVSGNTITVVRYDGENSKIYEYSITGNYADNTHMTNMVLTEAAEGETIGTVTFADTEVDRSIDITEANIYFDTTMPKVITEISANNPKTVGVYTEGEEFTIKATTSEAIQEGYVAPEINVKFGGKDGQFNNGKAEYLGELVNEDGTITWTYKYIVSEGDEGTVSLSYLNGSVTDLAGNNTTLTSLNSKADIFELNGITVDATAPTVTISAKDVNNNITNKNTLEYTFKWSEKVVGFTTEDITVNNGTKGTLSDVIENEDGTYSYTMTIDTNVEAGNTGDVQVIVEQNACQDQVGLSNVRTESVIRVDKRAPILIGIEASVVDPKITISDSVEAVKEYYKVGEVVEIVATFDENIANNTTNIPTLSLQFSESGNTNSTVSAGIVEGNKIKYTYTITDKDMGTLSIKGFTGTVVDPAGNETVVTKRSLDGDTILADTVTPTLVGITAIAQNFEYDNLLSNDGETKRYGKDKEITIITEYSEDVYNLSSSNNISKITENTVPTLVLKFGKENAKGTVNFDAERTSGNKVYYTYTIKPGDNGDLYIVSLNGKVSDIAGNVLEVNESSSSFDKYEESILDENEVEKIVADTKLPLIKITASAINYDDNKNEIKSNNYYRKGAVITIVAETDEYVYNVVEGKLERFNNQTAPELAINFTEEGEGKGTCAEVVYEDNKTIFTYAYEVKQGDNGKLNLQIAKDKLTDIALNRNAAKTEEIATVETDTIRPFYNDQPGIEYIENGYKVAFNEELYYITNSNEVKVFGDLSYAPVLKFEGMTTTYNPKISGSVITYVGEYINAKPYLGTSRLCDKAGNLYSYYDQEVPLITSVKVTSPDTGTYTTGEVITIIATFNEKVTGTAPALALQFAKSGDAKGGIVTNGVIEGNTITYTYTIVDEDNGLLSIKSITGIGLKDSSGNEWVAQDNITLSGNEITADTIAPTLTVSSDVERTNQDVVTYTFTWSEAVTGFDKDDIEVLNASKGDFEQVDEDGKVYTLTVDTTNEGRQIIKVSSGVCVDLAGNLNSERTTYNNVVIDYTKPDIRAQINGGNYMLDKENTAVVLKEKIVVNEELSKLEYAWSTSEATPETGWVTEDVNGILVNSDIEISKETNEAGTYYLHIKATDIAGNTLTIRTKAFIVTSDTTAPVITFNYTLTTTTVGNSIGATIMTDEDAIISYSWDNENWTTSEEYIRSVNAVSAPTEVGTYTLYAKAEDKSENESTVQKLEFTIVESPEEIKKAEIIFEDLPVVQIDGVKYVKIPEDMTSEVLTSKMNKHALLGKTPEYTKLTDGNDLRTGSEITLDGELRYIVVVKGDINCDGNVTFKDIIRTNAVRISSSESTLSRAQLLAADLNNSGKLEFRDIISINAIRINSVK